MALLRQINLAKHICLSQKYTYHHYEWFGLQQTTPYYSKVWSNTTESNLNKIQAVQTLLPVLSVAQRSMTT